MILDITPNGITELKRLTEKFHETDIVVQILSCSYPGLVNEPLIENHNATISDGAHYLPAIIDYGGGEPSMVFSVCRIKEAMLCQLEFKGHGPCYILIIKKIDYYYVNPLGKVLGSPQKDDSLADVKGNPIPIAALPYISAEKFPRIRVLVTYKSRLSDPRHGHHPASSPFFALHLLDESDEIRAYVRGDVALDIYDRFEEGKTYYIAGFRTSDRPYNFFFNLSNQQTIKLMYYTLIDACPQTAGLPQYRFEFVPISRLNTIPLEDANDLLTKKFKKCIDVIGIVRDVSLLDEDTEPFHGWPTGMPSRQVIIFDQSGVLLSVILWSYNAEEFTACPGDIIAFRHARLTEFSRQTGESKDVVSKHRVLSVITPSTVHVEPGVEECFALRQWYNSTSPLLSDFRLWTGSARNA